MNTKTRGRTRTLLALLALLAAVTVLSACGSDDEAGSGASGGDQAAAAPAKGKETDRAFIEDMVPHHESAIEMATIASERSDRPEIKKLAGDIISSQKKEIAQLKADHQRLFGAALPAGGKMGAMGMSEEEMGMGDMSMSELEKATPFDRAFIDMMVPHHRSAVKMAKMELEMGADPELKMIAQEIIDAQDREIGQMNEWRTEWYGAPVKEPAESKDSGSMPGMSH